MNYIAEIAEMLGVEEGEWFEVVKRSSNDEYIGFYKRKGDGFVKIGGEKMEDFVLSGIINGDLVVNNEEWAPAHGDQYWFVTNVDGEEVFSSVFSKYSAFDLAMLNMGNCFRNESIAKAYREVVQQKLYKVMSGRKGV